MKRVFYVHVCDNVWYNHAFVISDELQRKLWQIYISSGNVSFLPFIDNMDTPIHNIYMNIAIRDDLKWYSISEPIQSHGNEISQEAFKQKRDIKSPIPEDLLQTSKEQIILVL